MTRGAQQAGLYVEYGIDFAKGETWKYNFQKAGADYHQMSLDSWVHIAQAYSLDLKVDIMHLSPPCQPYSLAHTRPGRNDDMNKATLFGVGECIKKGKPRIVTLEETSGIITKGDSEEYFNRLIQQITSLGFSISWQLVNMQDYGVPQSRKRLVIIAAWYVPSIHTSLTLNLPFHSATTNKTIPHPAQEKPSQTSPAPHTPYQAAVPTTSNHGPTPAQS